MLMEKYRNLKLKNKLMFTLIPLVILLYGVSIVLVFREADKNVSDMARDNAHSIAEKYGNLVKADLLEKMQLARSLASVASKAEMFRPDHRRDRISEIIKKTVEDNPILVGAWTVWEPNAIDNRDAEFANAPGCDAEGRFAPYWVTLGGLHIEACVDYQDGNPNGEYYLRPKRLKRDVIMEPFSYKINNQDVMVVSLCSPIMVNNEVVGVAGVDLSMDKIQSLVDTLKLYDSGYSFLVSHNGHYAAHPKKEVVGKLYGTGQKIANIEEIIKNLTTGKGFELEKKSLKDGLNSFMSFVPFKVADNLPAWTFVANVPISKILERNDAMLWSMLIMGVLGILAFSVVIYFLSDYIAKPMVKLSNAAKQLAMGDMNVQIKSGGKDEAGELANAFVLMSTNIKSLIEDTHKLTKNTADGKLDFRADSRKYQGAYQELLSGVNETLDAVIRPLNVAAEYVDRISKGDLPPQIVDNYRGDFNEIKNNINLMIDSLGGFVKEMEDVNKLQASGNMNTYIDEVKFLGFYRNIAIQTNAGAKQKNELITEILDIVNQYGIGDFDNDMRKLPGDQAKITQSLANVKTNMVAVVDEIRHLIESATQGKLDIRGNANKFQGSYQRLIQGFNLTLDSIIGPLNVAAEYIDRISKGDMPPKIQDDYRGDFNEIKNNINQCIDAISSLVTDANTLSAKAIAGDISSRIDEYKHLGDYRKLVHEMNELMQAIDTPIKDTASILFAMSNNDYDAKFNNDYQGIWQDIKKATEAAQSRVNNFVRVIAHISEGDLSDYDFIKGVGKRSENDRLIPAGMKLIESIQGIKNELSELTDAITFGDLSQRSDESKFQGAYQEIATGINDALESVITPLKLNAEFMQRISNGDIPELIQDEANGDFEVFRQNINQCISAINLLITDSKSMSDAAIIGDFNKRADVKQHQGDFRKIVEGVNNTLDIVADKVLWYESIIDATPFPIHVIDMNMNWVFLNKAFEKLMVEQNIIKNRKEAVGMPCCSANANICNTDQCGIMQLHKGIAESYFDWCGMQCKQDTSYLVNSRGEKVGYVEIVTDLSNILYLRDYTRHEIERLSKNIEKLSFGTIDFDFNIQPAGVHTKDAFENFSHIDRGMKSAMDAIKLLISDSTSLAKSAVDGRLDARADVSKHQGDFRKIIEGVNNTLDAIIHPLNVSAEYMDRIAKGDIPPLIIDNYHGDFNEIKNNLNQCITAINSLVQDSKMLSSAAIEGHLDTRADEYKHNGEFRKIIQGLNETLEAAVAPTREAVNVLQAMAAGDLTLMMDGDFKGDHAILKDALNNTIDSINTILSEVSEVLMKVTENSKELSSTSNKLSEAASEQAASIEQMSSALTEIGSQVQTNAFNANQAKELAAKSREFGAKGNEEMQQLNVAMNDINESSKNIAKIIKVIDEIAFQTNLLALNAAVEAARAGVHGQGFAVVAEEVRNLAARSATAAKETADLIEGSIKTVDRGSNLSEKTAGVLAEIQAQSSKVADLITEIANASIEQSEGLAQLQLGFHQIDKITQQNTAGAEKTAESSLEMKHDSEVLSSMLSKFALRDNFEDSGIKVKQLKSKNRRFLESKNRRY